MLRRLGPLLVVFIACVWLNQSFGVITWEKIRDRVFKDHSASVFETLRYPFIFLYRRAPDEAMYYGMACEILGEAYDHNAVATYPRGRVPGAESFDLPPPIPDGHWHTPWTEVHLEYTAPVLPFVVGPKLVTTPFESYARLLGLIMGLCMVGSIALALDVLRRAGASRREIDGRWWLGAGLLLAQGSLTIQRLDPIVALAMMAAIHGAVRRSAASFGFWAGIAGACKIMPLFVVPVIIACDWPTWRPRLASLGAWIALALAVGFAPMLLASPTALLEFFRYHSLRGIQVESTFGALVGAVRLVLGTTQTASVSYGSFNVDGAIPDFLAKLCAPLTVASVAILVFAERRASLADEGVREGAEAGRVERIACAAVAATVLAWLTGKVLSPQYLTWMIPLTLAIPGRRGVVATWFAIGACAMTQLYYRGFYDVICEQGFVGVGSILARQAILVGLLISVRPAARSLCSTEPCSFAAAALADRRVPREE
jgi:hypothetical protein